ncbi:DUF58 domain-containing protein [Candidatus Sumerlaeota bacterium]|nr:DUF58 domain-containing protein [Candidatus Sumerlaeota bacterium]
MFVGLLVANPHLLALGAMCLVAIMLMILEAKGMLAQISVTRQHQPRAFQGQAVPVRLMVSCKGARSPELLLIEDYFPPASNSRFRKLVEYPLHANRLVEMDYYGPCDHRRGMYILGPVRLQAKDSLGFFSREVIIDEFSELLVYPQAVDLNEAELLGEGILAHVGLETTRRTGHSEEFLGVREYRAGDPTRLVHWKLSARHAKLIVKEFQEEMTTLVSFFIDLGKLSLVGVGDQTSVEYSIKCCASLAKHAVERGHSVQLFSISESVEHISAGAGIAHLLAMLDRLAVMRPQGDAAFSIRVMDLASTLPRGSTAILLFGAANAELESLSRAISIFVDRHILPIVVLIDDRTFIKVYREQEESHFKAPPLEKVAQHLMLMGARVHVVRRNKSMEQALLQGLEREGAA